MNAISIDTGRHTLVHIASKHHLLSRSTQVTPML